MCSVYDLAVLGCFESAWVALSWHLKPGSRPDTGATVPTNAHPVTGQENPDSPRTKSRVEPRVVPPRAQEQAIPTMPYTNLQDWIGQRPSAYIHVTTRHFSRSHIGLRLILRLRVPIFPAISFMTSTSIPRSTTSALSRLFSCLNCSSYLTSSVPMSPDCLHHV